MMALVVAQLVEAVGFRLVESSHISSKSLAHQHRSSI
jgi:hypothetical protein